MKIFASLLLALLISSSPLYAGLVSSIQAELVRKEEADKIATEIGKISYELSKISTQASKNPEYLEQYLKLKHQLDYLTSLLSFIKGTDIERADRDARIELSNSSSPNQDLISLKNNIEDIKKAVDILKENLNQSDQSNNNFYAILAAVIGAIATIIAAYISSRRQQSS
jgi:chromosome segregation ATPase